MASRLAGHARHARRVAVWEAAFGAPAGLRLREAWYRTLTPPSPCVRELTHWMAPAASGVQTLRGGNGQVTAGMRSSTKRRGR